MLAEKCEVGADRREVVVILLRLECPPGVSLLDAPEILINVFLVERAELDKCVVPGMPFEFARRMDRR